DLGTGFGTRRRSAGARRPVHRGRVRGQGWLGALHDAGRDHLRAPGRGGATGAVPSRPAAHRRPARVDVRGGAADGGRLGRRGRAGARGHGLRPMRAVVYRGTGDASVLQLVERPEPEPEAGEVLVRVAVSGVNPTDWKARRGGGRGPLRFSEIVPNQDGSGTIVAVGDG